MAATPDESEIATARRDFALQVVMRLRQAGFESLWAGGCVRDLLLDRSPTDYDVATSARPDQVRELFGHRRTLAVGAAFGVIIVLGPHGAAGQVEVATFRNDSQYSDGRRPDSVTFSTAREDALRRDFTINGMFFDPIAESVIDYVGGREDLRNGVIRAIGDADARISEDKLRMLRAVRFAARFGFTIEAATQAAIARHSSELAIVSGERVAGELGKTLITAGREMAVRRWAETGLMSVMLPELAVEWLGLADRVCSLVRSVRATHWISPLSAMLFPLVEFKAKQGVMSVGEVSRRLAQSLKGRLKLSNEEVARLGFALEHQAGLEIASQLRWSVVQPLLINSSIAVAVDLLAARQACGLVSKEVVDWLELRLRMRNEELNPRPWVDGTDLRALGLHPGPRFKELLDGARAAQLDGLLSGREAALKWLADQATEQSASGQ